MDAKEFLKRVRKIDILIENKHKEIDKLKRLYLINKSCGNKEATEIENYECDLTNQIYWLIETKQEIQSIIDQIKEAELIDILYKRYFDYKSWETIASELFVTFQWVHKLHSKALKEVQMILDGGNNETI